MHIILLLLFNRATRPILYCIVLYFSKLWIWFVVCFFCFCCSAGIGVRMTEPLYIAPSLADLARDVVFPQNLPSIVCVHVLDPQPGDIILDMCAAPGMIQIFLLLLVKIPLTTISETRCIIFFCSICYSLYLCDWSYDYYYRIIINEKINVAFSQKNCKDT